MANRMAQWTTAWIALALALGLHVADEALTGFLPVYNATVAGIRARHPWVPLPTFTFPVWLGGLILGVLVLLALTPMVSRGARWLRVASIFLGVIMTGNALGHIGASLYWGKPAPGVYSSPVLLIAAVALLVTASRGASMTTRERSAELAVGWIEAWIRMDMVWLRQRLAPDFVHVSPFGRFEDRESYLAAVEPMARKSVVQLRVKDVIASGNQAAVRFENRTAKGVVESCDWVRVENDVIKEIRSFYDSVLIREVLSPGEQKSLDGSY